MISYQVSDFNHLISQGIRTVDTDSDWLIANIGDGGSVGGGGEPRGEEFNPKKPSMGGIWIFPATTYAKEVEISVQR